MFLIPVIIFLAYFSLTKPSNRFFVVDDVEVGYFLLKDSIIEETTKLDMNDSNWGVFLKIKKRYTSGGLFDRDFIVNSQEPGRDGILERYNSKGILSEVVDEKGELIGGGRSKGKLCFFVPLQTPSSDKECVGPLDFLNDLNYSKKFNFIGTSFDDSKVYFRFVRNRL